MGSGDSTMKEKGAVVILAAAVLLLLLAPAVEADSVISEPGSGAGQTIRPQGLAVDFKPGGPETGRLYVADEGNNRINVFDPTGQFLMSFGWGVDTKAAEFQICTLALTCNAGTSGDGKGQFNSPTGAAVDPLSHNLYVVDFGNHRVQKFDVAVATADFLLMFGGGVNKTTGGDVCTQASGNTCGGGSNGTGEGEFSGAGLDFFVGIGPAGTVYVLDNIPFGGEREYRLQRFEPSGTTVAPQQILHKGLEILRGGRALDLAVDSSGDFYVTNQPPNEAVRKYDPSGEEIRAILGHDFHALAVDASDNLFVALHNGLEQNVAKYSPGGSLLLRFGYGSLAEIASALSSPFESATGDIFSSEVDSPFDLGRIVHLDFPPPGPIVLPEPCGVNPVGNTKATLRARINPEGKATTYHFEYISDADFVDNGNSFNGTNEATKTAESASIGSDFELHSVSAEADVAPETVYHCRVVATNADAPGGIAGQEGTFETKPSFECGAAWAADVSSESATINATVDPLGIPTTGFFEYVDDAAFQIDKAKGPEHDGFGTAQRIPPEGEELDFGTTPKTESASLSGLAPETSYHFRLRIKNSFFPVGKFCPPPAERPEGLVFTTFSEGSPGTPDGRGYELVSPGQKDSAEVAVRTKFASGLALKENLARIQAAAGSGETITYTSWTSFGEAEGAPGTSQYLSKRSAGGWATQNISPFGQSGPFNPPFRGFSPDLTFAAVVTNEPALTPDAIEGKKLQNLYLRHNDSNVLTALITSPPPLPVTEEFCPVYAGGAVDGSRVFFGVRGGPITPDAPVGKGFNLYEWSAGQGLVLVSRLPGEAPAPPSVQTGFGTGEGNCTTGTRIVSRVISDDGRRAFWTHFPKSGPRRLLVRIDGEETVQLDAKAGGPGQSGGGVFQTASTDGSRAFFIADSKLTSGAAEGSLYRYDLEAASSPLTSLTPTSGSEAAGVQGVVGASEDGSYVYFVATGVLSGEEVSSIGQKAIAGKNNLYLWHEGEAGVRFVANLAAADFTDWELEPRRKSARVTPDGRHLAFTSTEAEALAGYDNGRASGAGCQVDEAAGDSNSLCPQAFIYVAETGDLSCVSCNRAGSRPLGPSVLPGWSNPFEGPRYLSSDGSRLFFESFDALLPEDENEKRDVYEFERAGKGSCDDESVSFDAISSGCLYLISSAQSDDESYLLDASADGRDVFFATRQRLVGWDENDNYDVYDFREGGGFPEPPVLPPPCEGEACKPPPARPPAAGSPATPAFSGPGNAKPKPKKGKGKKGHRKGKKHKNSKKQRAGKARR